MTDEIIKALRNTKESLAREAGFNVVIYPDARAPVQRRQAGQGK